MFNWREFKKPEWANKIDKFDSRNELLPWEEQRLIVLKRDYFTCKKCHSKENLVVHHKNYAKEKGSSDELIHLITLCKNCHDSFHRKSKYDREKKKHIKR